MNGTQPSRRKRPAMDEEAEATHWAHCVFEVVVEWCGATLRERILCDAKRLIFYSAGGHHLRFRPLDPYRQSTLVQDLPSTNAPFRVWRWQWGFGRRSVPDDGVAGGGGAVCSITTSSSRVRHRFNGLCSRRRVCVLSYVGRIIVEAPADL